YLRGLPSGPGNLMQGFRELTATPHECGVRDGEGLGPRAHRFASRPRLVELFPEGCRLINRDSYLGQFAEDLFDRARVPLEIGLFEGAQGIGGRVSRELGRCRATTCATLTAHVPGV